MQGVLVFLRQDRTSRIDERAAWFEGPHGAVQKRALRAGTLAKQLLGQAAQALFVAVDDGARAGAGGVEQDAVKAEEFVELACVDTHDGHVFGALAVEVGLKLFGAGNAYLAGREMSLTLGEGGDLRRLATRGRAHVQDVLAGLSAQDQRRHHGRQALQIDFAVAVDVEIPQVGNLGLGQDKGVWVPGDGVVGDAGGTERRSDVLGGRLERVGAQRDRACGRGAEALDHELGIGGRIGAGDRVDHKARQVGGGVLGGKPVGKLGSSKLPKLELGLNLLFLLTTTRLGHPSFLPIPLHVECFSTGSRAC